MGGWAAPTGIEYVIDPLNAMVLVMVSCVGVLTTLWMARGLALDIAPEKRSSGIWPLTEIRPWSSQHRPFPPRGAGCRARRWARPPERAGRGW